MALPHHQYHPAIWSANSRTPRPNRNVPANKPNSFLELATISAETTTTIAPINLEEIGSHSISKCNTLGKEGCSAICVVNFFHERLCCFNKVDDECCPSHPAKQMPNSRGEKERIIRNSNFGVFPDASIVRVPPRQTSTSPVSSDYGDTCLIPGNLSRVQSVGHTNGPSPSFLSLPFLWVHCLQHHSTECRPCVSPPRTFCAFAEGLVAF